MATPRALVRETPTIDPAEWELRTQLAAAYRLVDHFGWTELIYGHLTARVPGEAPHFLINPYGLGYDEVTASNLVKIDVNGEIVGESAWPVNRAGFIIHSAIHMHHSDENRVVMHTHTRAGMAIAATEEGLLPISMNASGFHDRLSYHDYEGVSLYEDERERLIASLGRNKAMILRNHGLLTVGRTVAEAFVRLYRLERACQVQLDAAAAGTLRLLSGNLAAKSRDEVEGFLEDGTTDGRGAGFGELEFQALIRKLDRTDTSWRH